MAFGLRSGTQFDFVIRAKNGAFVTIAGPGTEPPGIGPLAAAYEPTINNNDVVAFMGNRAETGAGVLFTGAGAALTTIAFDSLSVFYGINDLGRVAFFANPGAIQTGDGGPVTIIALGRSREARIRVYRRRSVDQRGRHGGVHGIPAIGSGRRFHGPDPEADAVLKEGDPLRDTFGVLLGTVTSVGIMREALNDSGQVAMAVRYRTPAAYPRSRSFVPTRRTVRPWRRTAASRHLKIPPLTAP